MRITLYGGFFMTEQERIAAYAYMYQGSWQKIAKAIAADTEPVQAPVRYPYITILDDAYPQALKELRYPPWILFYRGKLSLLKQDGITVVGSRAMSGYGEEMTAMCADLLKDRFVLISGLARGVDGCVHRHGLCGKGTIGVTGCGLDRVYPPENRDLYRTMAQEQLILSEYPHGTAPAKHHFPWRNRILAALGKALIVTQSAPHSGTSITVNEALALGRDVWCVPYPLSDLSGIGNNWLIRDGAQILCSADDILRMKQIY